MTGLGESLTRRQLMAGGVALAAGALANRAIPGGLTRSPLLREGALRAACNPVISLYIPGYPAQAKPSSTKW